MNRKRPSGSFFRRQKMKKIEEDKKMSECLNNFLKNTSPPKPDTKDVDDMEMKSKTDDGAKLSAETNIISDGSNKIDLEDAADDLPELKTNASVSNDCVEWPVKRIDDEAAVDSSLPRTESVSPRTELVSTDCGEWPVKITDAIRQLLVERGPIQITDIRFPVDERGRRFTPVNYKRKLRNGEEVKRQWLIYSQSKNAIFCFCCRLFSHDIISLSGHDGYSDWQNMSRLLSQHEKSPPHIKSFQSWHELSQRLRFKKTIDTENERLISAETEHWYQVLKRLHCIIQFLGTQGLAFRGTSDTIFTDSNGNFLKLVEHISKFDIVLAEHLRRVTAKETHVHYLSKRIQNEFIALLSSRINDHILHEINKATYYSIILDCTSDVSHLEQMTIVVRFVFAESGHDIAIKEHFLGFVEMKDTTGEGLTNCLLNELSKRKMPLKNMRGQGYDNGSNMKGKNVGVQKRILDMNPRAFYVPCGSHSLNLVINDAALSCTVAVDFFNTVQEIYNFFSSSTYRWSILSKNVVQLTVKPLSNTRWESRIDALKPLRYNIEEIYDALYEAITDPKIDAFGKNKATGIAKKLKDFRFLCSLVTWHTILYKINIISKELQKENINLQSALNLIGSVKCFLETMRSEKGLNSVITDAKELAIKLETTSEFPAEIHIRPRKVKKQFSYEADDETLQGGKSSFKVNFFYVVLDTAINSLSERFELVKDHSDKFQFLYDIHSLREWDKSRLKMCCLNLQLSLTDGNECDVEADELMDELILLAPMLPEKSCPSKTLSYITINSLVDTFANTFISLRILLTIPVSVASGERSFSKLKLIKNYLRSTMSQERLNGLATIAIENEVLNKIDSDAILRDFAKQKARKIYF